MDDYGSAGRPFGFFLLILICLCIRGCISCYRCSSNEQNQPECKIFVHQSMHSYKIYIFLITKITDPVIGTSTIPYTEDSYRVFIHDGVPELYPCIPLKFK